MAGISTPAILVARIFLFFSSEAAHLKPTNNILSRENYVHLDSASKDTAYEFTARLVEAMTCSQNAVTFRSR